MSFFVKLALIFLYALDFILLEVEAISVFVTTPQILKEYNLTTSKGTLSAPYTSLAQTIYQLPENSLNTIYISPHEHKLDCLTSCNQCPVKCEIFRGGAVFKGSKNITIQMYQCSDADTSVMCYKVRNAAYIFTQKVQLVINLQYDVLVLRNLTVSGEQLSCTKTSCNNNKNRVFIKAQNSVLDFNNTIFRNFNLNFLQYFYITNSTFVFINSTVLNNIASDDGRIAYANNSYIWIQNTLVQENCGNILYGQQNSILVNMSKFQENTAIYGIINMFSSNISISNSSFIQNSAQAGGAIYILSSNLQSVQGIFQSNQATSNGGAFLSQQSVLIFIKSEFIENKANNGGAIFLSQSEVKQFQESIVLGNKATRQGGGIYAQNVSIQLMNNSNFEYNQAIQREGGAIFAVNSILYSIENCIFLQNTAKTSGGAIYMQQTQIFQILAVNGTKNTVSNSDGGYLYAYNSSIQYLLSSFFSQNTVKKLGGVFAFYQNSSVYSIQNNIFENNKAEQSGGNFYFNDSKIKSILNNIFTRNEALNTGGSFAVQNSIIYEFQSCLFDQNSAVKNAGAIQIFNSQIIQMDNIKAIQNKALTSYGGFLNSESSSIHHLQNSNFSENEAKLGGGVFSLFTNSSF